MNLVAADRRHLRRDPKTGQDVKSAALQRLDRWLHKRATMPVGQLGYEPGGLATAGSLRPPDEQPWGMWSAPRSLRDVEPEILLQLRPGESTWDSAPPWDFAPRADQGTTP